jgi:hypothetical protein
LGFNPHHLFVQLVRIKLVEFYKLLLICLTLFASPAYGGIIFNLVFIIPFAHRSCAIKLHRKISDFLDFAKSESPAIAALARVPFLFCSAVSYCALA